MLECIRPVVSISLFLALACSARAQNVAPDDAPKPLVARKPPTQQERDRREALYAFVRGHQCVRQDRLLEALKAFEESARLDPEPIAVYRSQIPILIALERGGEAAEMCQKVVKRNPDDCEAWAILGRLHKALGQTAEAKHAFEQGLKSPLLEDRPELAQQLFFELGAMHEADSQFAAAADAYHKAAELLDHPDLIAEHVHVGKDLVVQRAAEMYERIGDLYRKAKKYNEAASAYTKAQARAPMRAERLNYNLAQIWQEKGDDAKALACVEAYLRTQPLGMDAHEMKVGILRRMDKSDAIVPWLEDVAKLDKYNVALHLLLARECARAKQTARAEQIYRTLAETGPSAELYRDMFRMWGEESAVGVTRPAQALDDALGRATAKAAPDAIAAVQAKAMIAAIRDDAEVGKSAVAGAFKLLNKGTPLRPVTLQVLAVVAEKHQQLTEAEKFYRGSVREVSPEAETLIYGGLIRVLAKERKFAAQLEVCDGALNGDPAHGLPKAQATSQVLFQTERARALAGLKRFDEAIQSIDRAMLIAGDNNKQLVRHLRVRLLAMANRHDDAIKECDAMLKQAMEQAEVLEVRYLLSNIYSNAKQFAKSEEQLQMILKADPDNAPANNDLGYLWADQNKNLAEAEKMIRKAIDADRRQRQGIAAPSLPGEPAAPPPVTPVVATSQAEVEDNAAYLDSLGWVLFRRGQIEQARKELERAAHLPDGEDPVIWDHLGDVYHQLKMPTEARRAWERALKLYDDGQRRLDDDRREELQRKIRS